ncbi:MAG: substrate-binding domain-containing protein [Oscillospiraceae bacterium]|nr:substrate-binding domain-containing protein [Oscillospiraceae bacterium]
MARKKRIGIIMGRIYKPLNKKLLSGILEQARALGYSAFVFTLNEDCSIEKVRNGERNLFHALHFSQLDGIVFAPYSFDSHFYSEWLDDYLAENCDKPIVRIGRETERFLPVWYDDKEEIAEIALHLIYGHGCRKLLCLTGPEDSLVARNRAQGFLNAVASAGLPVNENAVIYGDFWLYAAQKLAEEIAAGTRERPDAVVCANDTMAIALCDAMNALGISVPEDILVTGYDGTPDTLLHIPAVTTFQPPHEMLGRNAVCALYEAVSGEHVQPIRIEKGTLHCRESCGCRSPHEAFSTHDFTQIIPEEGILDCTVSATFYEAVSLHDLVDRMFSLRYKFMADKTIQTERLFLCLCDDWDSVTQTDGSRTYRSAGYSDTMYLIGSEGSRLTFPLEEMLPASLDTDTLTTAFFMPVHFQDQCFGYIALEVEDCIDDFNIHYIRFCREVNNALKFLCTQNVLKRLLYREKIARSRDDLTGLYRFDTCKEIWTELQDHANAYREQLYLIVIAAGGLRHIENAAGSVESDRYLASFADVLARCCSKEKIFQLESRSFVIIGSGREPEKNTATYLQQIRETAWNLCLSDERKYMVYARTSVRILPAGTSLPAEEAEAEIQKMLDTLSDADQKQLSEHLHDTALFALRREIYLHPEADWNGELCSARLNISKSYFHKLYLKVFGVSFMQDLQQSRLNRAKQLLVTTPLLLPDIAERCGYDYYNFMRFFKKEMGMTPTQYRKNKR